MTDFIRRVLTATEGSEELDAEVVAYLNRASVKRYPPTDDFGPRNCWQFWSIDGAHFLGNEANPKFKVHPYTRSVEAALTLLPTGDGWSWKLVYESVYTDAGPAYCVVLRRAPRLEIVAPAWVASRSTLPLAITAVALSQRYETA